MKDVVFTCYAFGEIYLRQQERLKNSILNIYPDANIRFWNSKSGSTHNNLDEMPPGSRTFHESTYGFKVHCVNSCLNEGFKKIIFMDPAVVLESKIESILENLEKEGVMCTKDPWPLEDRVSYKCLSWLGKTKEDIKHLTLVGGSLYLFDFNHPVTQPFFDMWMKMEEYGLFGSEPDAQQPWWNGHRQDEACFSLCMDRYDLKPKEVDDWDSVGYSNLGKKTNRIFVFHKYHFRNDPVGEFYGHSIYESLLPINANVLDLGCRDFNFTDKMRELEHTVYPVDIGEFDGDHYRIAISDKDGRCGVVNEEQPDATHIKNGDEIPMMTMESFSKHVGVDHWDFIKMDIEGEELNILMNAEEHPIASQVSVEFHTHCTDQTKEQVDECLDYLSEWYNIYNRNWDYVDPKNHPEQGVKNYWDVLLVAN